MMRSIRMALAMIPALTLLMGCAGTRIDGTYALVERRLPDGSVQTPPTIVGSAMFHDGVRSIVVNWKDAEGRNLTVASIAEFTLEQYRYTDTNVLYLTNDGGMLYETDANSASEEVVYTEKGLRFKLPLHPREPVLEFSRDGFTATSEAEFIDVWRRVGVIRDDERKAREAEERAAREAAARAEAERKAAEDAADEAESSSQEPQK